MTDKKDISVLITAAGNVFMPGTTSCIKNNGERTIRLVGADMSEDSTILQMCDAAYPVPRGTDPSYTDVLLNICREEKIDILLPIMSVELDALAVNKDKFAAIGTRVSVSDAEALSVANNKRKLLDFMKQNGLPCADYYTVHSIEEIKETAAKLGYPEKRICIKATDGSGSRGFRILDETFSRFDSFLHDKPSSGIIRMEELVSVLEEAEVVPEMIVMEYLPGPEYSVDLLADKGNSLITCCRKSLRMENSIMLEAEIVNNPAVTSLCEQTTRLLGLDGNIGFDIRERADGTPLIMECNPRITAGIPFFALAGVNLPYLCIKKLLGEELPHTEPVLGTIIKRRWLEMPI